MPFVPGPQLQHLTISTLAEATAPLGRMRQSTMRLKDGFMRLSEANWTIKESALRTITIRGMSATGIRLLRGR